MAWRAFVQRGGRVELGYTQTRWHTFKRLDSVARTHERLPSLRQEPPRLPARRRHERPLEPRPCRVPQPRRPRRVHRAHRTRVESPVEEVFRFDEEDRRDAVRGTLARRREDARAAPSTKPRSAAPIDEDFGDVLASSAHRRARGRRRCRGRAHRTRQARLRPRHARVLSGARRDVARPRASRAPRSSSHGAVARDLSATPADAFPTTAGSPAVCVPGLGVRGTRAARRSWWACSPARASVLRSSAPRSRCSTPSRDTSGSTSTCGWRASRVAGSVRRDARRGRRRRSSTTIFAIGAPVLAAAPSAAASSTSCAPHFELYCKLVPVRPLAALADASIVRPERVDGVDVLIVRDNMGGLYQGRFGRRDGGRVAYQEVVYDADQVDRVLEVASRARRGAAADASPSSPRRGGIPEVSALWRERAPRPSPPDATSRSTKSRSTTRASNSWPTRGASTWSPLPTCSATWSPTRPLGARIAGHGRSRRTSAPADAPSTRPDTARPTTSRVPARPIPIAQIQSLAMLLRESFDLPDAAQAVEDAVVTVLAPGVRTADIAGPGSTRRRDTRALAERVAASDRQSSVRSVESRRGAGRNRPRPRRPPARLPRTSRSRSRRAHDRRGCCCPPRRFPHPRVSGRPPPHHDARRRRRSHAPLAARVGSRACVEGTPGASDAHATRTPRG